MITVTHRKTISKRDERDTSAEINSVVFQNVLDRKIKEFQNLFRLKDPHPLQLANNMATNSKCFCFLLIIFCAKFLTDTALLVIHN